MTSPTRDLADSLGRTVWFDLPVVDLGDAMSFYEGLLNWDYVQMEESALSDYVIIRVHGTPIGGLRKIPTPHPVRDEHAGPVLYFTVEKLEPKVIRAKELGAKLVGSTVNLGRERGRYQWIRDREGNLIGLWAPQ